MTSTSEMDSQGSRMTLSGSRGVRLIATTFGNESDPPLLFLHGGGQQRSSWAGAARFWGENGWQSITLDARGHGESDWSPDGYYLLDAFADDLANVVTELGRAPVVVGASLGGLTGLVAEGSRPGLLRGLVMVDVSIITERRGAERIRSFMTDRPDGFASLEEARAAVVAYASGRRSEQSVDGLRKALVQRSDGRWYWRWDQRFLAGPQRFGGFTEASLRKAASAVACPLLLVRGALSDVLSEAGVKALVEAQPRTVVSRVQGMGHMVSGQDNGAFGGALTSFLESL